MKKIAVAAALMAIGGIAQAEFVTGWDKGWRLTIGPQFDFNASGRLGVKANAIPLPASSSSGNRAQAQAAGDAISMGDGRTDFPNGAFVDPDDAAGISGETWNWRVPAGQLNNGHMSFAHTYVEQSTVYESVGGGRSHDDNWAAGANFGLDRRIWQNGDFGIEVGFNFAFFIRNNWYKGAAGGYRHTDTTRSGSYLTDVDMGNADVMTDPWTRNPDGSYGAGSFDGPGPVISPGEISISHQWGAETSSSSTSVNGPFSIRGDLQMYEFQLALKPYYELTEWFMVRGTFGVGVDYRKFDVEVDRSRKESSRDWDCYMLCGVGGMFHHENFCLGFDFLRRVFDDDLRIDTNSVDGTIRNSNWMFRVYVGYEF